jgi:hypothetical protein
VVPREPPHIHSATFHRLAAQLHTRLNSDERRIMRANQTPLFLSQLDIINLTGHDRPIMQARWLRSHGIAFVFNGVGSLVVAVLTVQEKLSGSGEQPDLQEGEESTFLGGITEAWDKVSEKQMAELLGITLRAIQGRRTRGKIPNHIWRRIDGHVVYSIRRFEEWLEGHWPPLPVRPREPSSAKARYPSKTRKDRQVYKLV